MSDEREGSKGQDKGLDDIGEAGTKKSRPLPRRPAGLGPASRAPNPRSGPLRGTLPADDAPRVLDVANVSKRFHDRTVLDDVTFHIPVGEFLCLCGPNGAGKSTLLKIILGLVEP